MRVPEKPASAALSYSAPSDRRDALAVGPLRPTLPFRLNRTLGDFTTILATPPPSAAAHDRSTPADRPAPASSPSQELSSPSPKNRSTDRSSESEVSEADVSETGDAQSDEESEELRSEDPQSAIAAAQPATLPEPAVGAGQEIAGDAQPAIDDSVDSEASQRRPENASPANAANPSGNGGDDNLLSPAADAQQAAAPTAAPHTNDASAKPAEEVAATPAAKVAQLADDTGATQDADPSGSSEPVSQSPVAGSNRRGADSQAAAAVTAATATPEDTEAPADTASLEQTDSRSGRRSSAGAARSRDAATARRTSEAKGSQDRPTPVTAAMGQNVPQLPTDAAAAQAAGNPAVAATDAVALASQAPAAALAAATAVRAATGEAAGNSAPANDAASPTAVSAADAGDRVSDPATGQRAAEMTRTDIADRARLVHRIAKALTKMGTDGGQVRMRMHPESLGSVLLEMRVRGKSVEARVTAANEASLELLRQQLPDLRQRLEGQGMTVQRLDVELRDEHAAADSHPFSDFGNGGPWNDDASREGRSGGQNRWGQAARAGQAAATAADPRRQASSMLSSGAQPAAPGTLDLRL